MYSSVNVKLVKDCIKIGATVSNFHSGAMMPKMFAELREGVTSTPLIS